MEEFASMMGFEVSAPSQSVVISNEKRPTKKHYKTHIEPFRVELFIRAKFRLFFANVTARELVLSLNPDAPPYWPAVTRIEMMSSDTMFSDEEARCPICLEANLTAPRVAKCGHYFCWPCILRYLGTCKDSAPARSLLPPGVIPGSKEAKEFAAEHDRAARMYEFLMTCDKGPGANLRSLQELVYNKIKAADVFPSNLSSRPFVTPPSSAASNHVGSSSSQFGSSESQPFCKKCPLCSETIAKRDLKPLRLQASNAGKSGSANSCMMRTKVAPNENITFCLVERSKGTNRVVLPASSTTPVDASESDCVASPCGNFPFDYTLGCQFSRLLQHSSLSRQRQYFEDRSQLLSLKALTLLNNQGFSIADSGTDLAVIDLALATLDVEVLLHKAEASLEFLESLLANPSVSAAISSIPTWWGVNPFRRPGMDDIEYAFLMASNAEEQAEMAETPLCATTEGYLVQTEENLLAVRGETHVDIVYQESPLVAYLDMVQSNNESLKKHAEATRKYLDEEFEASRKTVRRDSDTSIQPSDSNQQAMPSFSSAITSISDVLSPYPTALAAKISPPANVVASYGTAIGGAAYSQVSSVASPSTPSPMPITPTVPLRSTCTASTKTRTKEQHQQHGKFFNPDRYLNEFVFPKNCEVERLYQVVSGDWIFLSPLCHWMILKEFGDNLHVLPSVLKDLKIEEVEKISVTEDIRKRIKFLSHVPLSSEVQLVHVDLSSVLSPRTKEFFSTAISRLSLRRRSKAVKNAEEEREQAKLAEKIEREHYSLMLSLGLGSAPNKPDKIMTATEKAQAKKRYQSDFPALSSFSQNTSNQQNDTNDDSRHQHHTNASNLSNGRLSTDLSNSPFPEETYPVLPICSDNVSVQSQNKKKFLKPKKKPMSEFTASAIQVAGVMQTNVTKKNSSSNAIQANSDPLISSNSLAKDCNDDGITEEELQMIAEMEEKNEAIYFGGVEVVGENKLVKKKLSDAAAFPSLDTLGALGAVGSHKKKNLISVVPGNKWGVLKK